MAPSLDSSTQKVTSIRHVNNIQYQFCCPVQTPEGQKIGIHKSLSMISTITNQDLSQKNILELINDFKEVEHPYSVNPLHIKQWGKVFMNGNFDVLYKKILDLYLFLRNKK